ncbi:phytoene desaturase family protein [Alkalihalobacillus sp. LMS39]|uniref:phytoene desaturase family protein n=1 Tax=Alkalihalobacillus sp. LMS39 TaxID=2924032 RepID=UPI001FB43DE3|nr:phytoene desaturase family protein [Alkalihalobacillus sp. LMS39]UOE96101.1 phytoene desaturase family protein [Alkalihalobacillus sp. LMS39]
MKTAIIGGGIGGLISGLYAQKRGEDVTIFEKESKVGGRLSFIEKDGYRVDKGPTIVLLPQMIKDILEEVGITENQVEFIQIDPLYKINYSDGSYFFKWSNINEQMKEIQRKFPGEEEGFPRYLNEMKERFSKGKQAFLDKSFERKSQFWTVKNIQTLWQLRAYETVQQQMKRYFLSPKLQEAFSFQTLYIGGAPFRSPAMYSLVPYSEHVHGIWYVKGGYASLIEVLIEKIKEHPTISIRTNTEIKKIIVEKNRCTAIQTKGNEDIRVDHVIVNGDFPLMEQLVEQKSKKPYIPSSGCLLIYLGLNKVYQDANVHQYFMSDSFSESMEDVFVYKRLPKHPCIYTFHPSVIDSSLAPEGKGVMYILVPVPSSSSVDWNNIDSYVDLLLEEVESRGFPQLREAIEWKVIRTPEQAKKEGLYEGGSFGIAPTLLQSGVFRPQLKPFRYENVYAVGASVHPGGGIPIVMQGAKLLNEYRKGSDSFDEHRASV